jgi:putative transposase
LSYFCIEALEEALANHGAPDYFNIDQGAQFTCNRFIVILKSHKEKISVKISMDGRGRALDNIFIERFWRTLKYEEVYIKSYQNLMDCKKNLSEYLKI